MSYNDQGCPLRFAIHLLKFSPNMEKCQSNIARHIRIPTITATINPTIPMIMSKFAPLLLLRIFFSNIHLLLNSARYGAIIFIILR
jgi:hypothetical protein